jgi:hypothetical protein
MTRSARAPPSEASTFPDSPESEIEENIAEMIREAKAPTGEMADLAGKAQRLGRALKVAQRWMDAALDDTEMFGRAQIAHDQLEEELSRTVFTMDVVSGERIIAQGQRERGEASEASEEELRRMSRENVVADELLAAYITLSHAPPRYSRSGVTPSE